jgi:hypothetical protein
MEQAMNSSSNTGTVTARIRTPNHLGVQLLELMYTAGINRAVEPLVSAFQHTLVQQRQQAAIRATT